MSKYFIALIILLSTSKVSNSQEIDPRQYVNVLYKKISTNSKIDTIWNWETRKNIPNQKITTLNTDGEINIFFTKTELSFNRFFEGTFSLEAEISGPNGTRRIEVNPYSEIGVQRIPVGIKSEPPSQLTMKLINVLYELKTTDSIHYYRTNYLNSRYNYLTSDLQMLDQRLKNLSTEISKSRPDINILIRESILLDSASYYSMGERFFTGIRSITDFSQKITTLNQELPAKVKQVQRRFLDDLDELRKILSLKTDIVLEYLTSFETAGSDATKAFLALLNKDEINFNSMKNRLRDAQLSLKTIPIINIEKFSSSDSLNNFISTLVSTSNILFELSQISNSQLAKIILDTETENGPVPYTTNIYWDEGMNTRRRLYAILEKYPEVIAEKVSVTAANTIYRKLVYGTIDLGKSGARDGEVLNIYVTWILDSKRDSLSNSPRLPIGKYYIRETGWKFSVTDMFALVKRIKEEDVDQTQVSPTNFKGSGGAVLMWTFNKEDRGIKITPTGSLPSSYKISKRNRLMNFLEPSVGLNVSYLDFSTEKDVEIGTGLQLGIFRNKIFFGYGVNLHMLRPKNQSPNYFYIGFSFAQLSDLFGDNNKISSIR